MNPLGIDVWRLSNNEDQAFLIGKVVGLYRVSLISFHEISSTPTHVKDLEEIVGPFHEASQASDVSPGLQPILLEVASTMSSQPLSEANVKIGLQWVKGVLVAFGNQPPEIANPFFNGFSTALTEGVPNGNNFPEKTLPRGNLYRILLDNWQHIETLRSMKEIHKWACEQLDDCSVGDLPTFTRLCNRFGLTRGRTGRPRKSRT